MREHTREVIKNFEKKGQTNLQHHDFELRISIPRDPGYHLSTSLPLQSKLARPLFHHHTVHFPFLSLPYPTIPNARPEPPNIDSDIAWHLKHSTAPSRPLVLRNYTRAQEKQKRTGMKKQNKGYVRKMPVRCRALAAS
jgi:hypothetical protein